MIIRPKDYESLLPEGELVEIIENVIGQTLTAKFGCPVFAKVEVTSDCWSAELTGYRKAGLDSQPFNIDTSELPAKTYRQIVRRVQEAILWRQAINEYQRLKFMVGTNVKGEITKIDVRSGIVNIRFEDKLYREWHGIYPKREHPAKERDKYRIGQVLELHISNCFLNHETKKIEIVLSRRAKGFASQVLYRILYEGGEDLSDQKIKCLKRTPGYYCILAVRHKIPREAILQAVRELREKVIITPPGGKKITFQKKDKK